MYSLATKELVVEVEELQCPLLQGIDAGVEGGNVGDIVGAKLFSGRCQHVLGLLQLSYGGLGMADGWEGEGTLDVTAIRAASMIQWQHWSHSDTEPEGADEVTRAAMLNVLQANAL